MSSEKRVRDASPLRKPPLPALISQTIKNLIQKFPSITVCVGHNAIEDSESPLAQIRNKTILTASSAGILWNCKRGTSLRKYLNVLLKREEPTPFNDFALQLMAAGREAEPRIMQHFTECMSRELRNTIPGALFYSMQPGPVQHEHSWPYGLYYTAATADGLWVFGIPRNYQDNGLSEVGGYEMVALSYEVKFFASKAEMPESLPSDYCAQVLMQMIHYGHTVGLLIGAVCVDGHYQYRVWMFQMKTDGPHSHVKAYFDRLFDLARMIDTGQVPNQTKKTEIEITDVVVGFTDSVVEVLDFIVRNKSQLIRSERDQLALSPMGPSFPSTLSIK